MKYLKAKKEDLERIYQLVQNTIQAIYPKYYPQEVVDFFCNLHSRENIAADIESGLVRVLSLDNCLIGTGTCIENHILRLFVLPDLQNNGYGIYILQRLEEEIALNYSFALLDASLSATIFYEHQGYRTIYHNELSINNDFRLVYGIMEKTLVAHNSHCTSPQMRSIL